MKENKITDIIGTSVYDGGVDVGNIFGQTLLTTLDKIIVGKLLYNSPSEVIIQGKFDTEKELNCLIFEAYTSEITDANLNLSWYFKTNGKIVRVLIKIYDLTQKRLIYQNVDERDFLLGGGDILQPNGILNLKYPMKGVGGRKYKAEINFSSNIILKGTIINEEFVPYFKVLGKGINYENAFTLPYWKEKKYLKGDFILENGSIFICKKTGLQKKSFDKNKNNWVKLNNLILKLLGD